jgi:hypothetical protein
MAGEDLPTCPFGHPKRVPSPGGGFAVPKFFNGMAIIRRQDRILPYDLLTIFLFFVIFVNFVSFVVILFYLILNTAPAVAPCTSGKKNCQARAGMARYSPACTGISR